MNANVIKYISGGCISYWIEILTNINEKAHFDAKIRTIRKMFNIINRIVDFVHVWKHSLCKYWLRKYYDFGCVIFALTNIFNIFSTWFDWNRWISERMIMWQNTHITENIQQTLQVDIRPSKRSIFLKFVL